MLDESIKGISKFRDDLHAFVAANPDATTKHMGANAMMFLDTAYMWTNVMLQVTAQRQAAVGKAEQGVEDGSVVPVDFTQK
jgi:hypothetical protein